MAVVSGRVRFFAGGGRGRLWSLSGDAYSNAGMTLGGEREAAEVNILMGLIRLDRLMFALPSGSINLLDKIAFSIDTSTGALTTDGRCGRLLTTFAFPPPSFGCWA